MKAYSKYCRLVFSTALSLHPSPLKRYPRFCSTLFAPVVSCSVRASKRKRPLLGIPVAIVSYAYWRAVRDT